MGAAMHRLANYAAEMMERRLQIKEPPAFRDLASYLVCQGPLYRYLTIADRDVHADRGREHPAERFESRSCRRYPRRCVSLRPI